MLDGEIINIMKASEPDIINGRPGKLPPQRPPETRYERERDITVALFAVMGILIVAYFALKAAAIIYR